MIVKALLILKVLDNKLNIIGINNQLPSFVLNDSKNIKNQISDFLKSTYNIYVDWIDLIMIDMEIMNNELQIFYSSFVPKDFITNDIKFINDFSSMDFKTQEIINKSLRVSPY